MRAFYVCDINKGTDNTDAASVLSKMLELGIEMPTNREELNFFKEDFKALVIEYGLDIPEDTMLQVISLAADNSTKGEQKQSPSGEKEMTSSDKARLRTWQEAAKDDKEDGLIVELVEKYGSVTVQKEMGL